MEFLPLAILAVVVYLFIIKPMQRAKRESAIPTHNGKAALLDDCDVDVVGESFYQKNLIKIAGGKSSNSAEIETVAYLVPEDDNEKDTNAVRVEIDDMVVGYLSQPNAKAYRKAYSDSEHSCDALITGGWDRGGGDTGSFGVRLNINLHP